MADDYPVGYGKPPHEHRFRKGTSGNPRGRPRGSRNFKTELREELDSEVVLTEGGKTTTCTKLQALVKRLVNQALGGDLRATAQLLKQIEDVEATATPDDELPSGDRAILDRFVARVMAGKTQGGKP